MKQWLSGALLATILTVGTSTASAWDGVGHEQVNDLAWALLKKESKQKIALALLQGDPLYRPEKPYNIITDTYLETQVRPMFRKAAVWADDIKGKPSGQYEDWINRYNQASPGVKPPADVFQRGTEETRMKTWHYVDFPVFFAGSGEPTPPRESNALYGLNIVTQKLKSSLGGERQNHQEAAFWIYWATHIIGDLHQPLHCTEHFGPAFLPGGDDGGNQFMIKVDDSDREFRLHGWWDDGIEKAIKADGLTSTLAVTNSWLNRADLKPSESDVANLDWKSIAESYAQVSVQEVYRGLTLKGKIPADYTRRTADLSRKQAVLAGHRLARFLNNILAPNEN